MLIMINILDICSSHFLHSYIKYHKNTHYQSFPALLLCGIFSRAKHALFSLLSSSSPLAQLIASSELRLELFSLRHWCFCDCSVRSHWDLRKLFYLRTSVYLVILISDFSHNSNVRLRGEVWVWVFSGWVWRIPLIKSECAEGPDLGAWHFWKCLRTFLIRSKYLAKILAPNNSF